MSADVDPDEVTVKVQRRETRSVRTEMVDHAGQENHYSDTVTIWARVSGAAPVRKTKTITFEVSHLVLKFHRVNGGRWSADLSRASVMGYRVTRKGLGSWQEGRFFFADDVPEWLKVFESETRDTLPH
jgi:hypothetical protein